jgi:pimeloyl-ACP methyl ester carboxylesterase
MKQNNVESLLHWHASGQYFTYQGHEIFYQYQSNDNLPCLLLIHGYPSASWDWHLQWLQLSKHFQLITLDMLGFGFSAKPRHVNYSIHLQADIISALLRQLKIASVHVLSHDYGDTVAQELLARSYHQEHQAIHLASLCLLNGGLFPETHKPLLLQKLLISPIGPLVAQLASFGKFKKSFVDICAVPLAESELKNLWSLVTFNQGKPILAKLIGYMQERKKFRQRWVEALQYSEIPLRLIDGMQDPISGAHMVIRFRQLVKNADVVELAGVGHYPQLEAPEATLNAFLAFHDIEESLESTSVNGG